MELGLVAKHPGPDQLWIFIVSGPIVKFHGRASSLTSGEENEGKVMCPDEEDDDDNKNNFSI